MKSIITTQTPLSEGVMIMLLFLNKSITEANVWKHLFSFRYTSRWRSKNPKRLTLIDISTHVFSSVCIFIQSDLFPLFPHLYIYIYTYLHNYYFLWTSNSLTLSECSDRVSQLWNLLLNYLKLNKYHQHIGSSVILAYIISLNVHRICL